MAWSEAQGLNPMNLTEVRRRIKRLRVLERPRSTGWDAELEGLYHELFRVRVSAKTNFGDGAHIGDFDMTRWRGGSVYYDLACTWPLPESG